MKHVLLMLLIASSGITLAQNQISTPAGTSLTISTEQLKLTKGFVQVNNVPFITLRAGDNTSSTTIANTQNTFIGLNAGNLTTTGKWNTFVGESSGDAITTGNYSTYIGAFSGMANTTGTNNTFLGYKTGLNNTTGSFNVAIGNAAGTSNTIGTSNTMVGLDAGWTNSSGSSNVFLGRNTGFYNSAGSNNLYLGNGAGFNNLGSGNVFLGNAAGGLETNANNKLYINNSNSATPLIYGEFSNTTTTPAVEGRLIFRGKTGISTAITPSSLVSSYPNPGSTVNTSTYQLFVKGGIVTEGLVVAGGWADYVFEDNYKLKSLPEVENFIKVNGHLPNVPSSKDIEKYGIDVPAVTKIQQEKIEELTLYLIDLNKKVEMLEKKINVLSKSKSNY